MNEYFFITKRNSIGYIKNVTIRSTNPLKFNKYITVKDNYTEANSNELRMDKTFIHTFNTIDQANYIGAYEYGEYRNKLDEISNLYLYYLVDKSNENKFFNHYLKQFNEISQETNNQIDKFKFDKTEFSKEKEKQTKINLEKSKSKITKDLLNYKL